MTSDCIVRGQKPLCGSCFDFLKAHLGGFEGVVWREGDVQEENSSLVHGARGAQDGGAPLIDVVSFGPGTEGNTERHETWRRVHQPGTAPPHHHTDFTQSACEWEPDAAF